MKNAIFGLKKRHDFWTEIILFFHVSGHSGAEEDIIKEEEKLKCILCKTVFDTKEEQIAHECSSKPPSGEAALR